MTHARDRASFTVLSALWLHTCMAVMCRAEIPLCPRIATTRATAIHQVTSDIRLEPETLLMFRPPGLPAIIIEARYGEAGELTCFDPLSGWSIYWDAAVATLRHEASQRMAAAGSSQIFVFGDLGRSAIQHAMDSVRGSKGCSDSEAIETTLSKGLGYLTAKKYLDAEECYSIALRLVPASMAANYGAARAAGLQGNQAVRFAIYERLANLAPQFYEARIELAYAYSSADRSEDAERVLRQVISQSPLPIQRRCFEALTFLFDKVKRRAEAAQAKKSFVLSEVQLRSRYEPLVDKAILVFDTKDLAAREEELGDYRSALNDFAEAGRLSSADKASEAVRFQADLGRLRNLKRLGDIADMARGCDDWRTRLNKLGRELDDIHWGGRAVILAQWEISCGVFGKGVSMLAAETKRVPDSDVPYRALESAYRSVGQSEIADRAGNLAERVRANHDNAVLKGILREADQLAREGNAFEIKR